MRKDATSQIETCEISDSELDNISGGIAGAAVNAAGYGAYVGVGDVVGAAGSQVHSLPVSQFTGLVTVLTTTPGL
jgi:bacteriocin-like protein